MIELFRALGALLETPSSENRMLGHLLELGPVPDESTHADLFLFQLYPYASVFLGEDGRAGGEARDRVAGFWRALDAEAPEEPDNLATLLAAYSSLLDSEAACPEGEDRVAWVRVRHAFLWEHVLSWCLPFLIKLRQIAPPFYVAWADTLESALAQESAMLGPPKRTPLALRVADPLPDPREAEGGAFLTALLSPARSGLVLTRGDLARAARDLGLGLRVGERAYILKAMMSQGPRETLVWLAREARSWERLHDRSGKIAPEVADFWAQRARKSAVLLEELATEVTDERELAGTGAFSDGGIEHG
ncbi:MAG: molecular chaperone TorD family protein [Gemmatimonadetes bacterium]|nr:molecular chaperone TorD family protein [Gemmatimonadota bacterium]